MDSGKKSFLIAYPNRTSDSTYLNIALKSRTGVVGCLACLPDGLHLLHHDSRLAYRFFCSTGLVLWDVVHREERRLRDTRRSRESTRQWHREGHGVSSGILLLRDQSLGCRHILGHPAGRRFPSPPVLQWFFIVIIIMKSDNNIGWSYRKESELETKSRLTRRRNYESYQVLR